MGQDGRDTPEDLTEQIKKSAKRRKVWKYTGLGIVILAIIVTVATVPAVVISRRQTNTPKEGLAIEKNFPDPGFVYFNKTWYAFATNSIVNDLSEVFHVPVAVSSDFKHWNITGRDALPTLTDWETSKDHWAPDVIRRVSYPSVIYRLVIWFSHTSSRVTESSFYIIPGKRKHLVAITVLASPFPWTMALLDPTYRSQIR